MDKFSLLCLHLLPHVSSAYTNQWWSSALSELQKINGDRTLRLINEDQMGLDVIIHKGYKLKYPTFNSGFNPEPGLYHLNIQTSNTMFAGWLQIVNDESIAWWGQGDGDFVNFGYAGDCDCINDYQRNGGIFEGVIDWPNHVYYRDTFTKGTSIQHILTSFDK